MQEGAEPGGEVIRPLVEARIVELRRDERGVIEALWRQRDAGGVHRLDHADAEELVACGAYHDVALPEQPRVALARFEVAEVMEVARRQIAEADELRAGVVAGFPRYGHAEVLAIVEEDADGAGE